MSLGGNVFEVIGLNFQSIDTESESVWAEFARFGLEDGAQFTGHRRTLQTIRGLLFPAAFGGLSDYDGIRAAQRAGRAVPLIRMGRGFAARVLGTVTIERVSDTEDYIAPNGRPQRLSFEVEVKSYGGAL